MKISSRSTGSLRGPASIARAHPLVPPGSKASTLNGSIGRCGRLSSDICPTPTNLTLGCKLHVSFGDLFGYFNHCSSDEISHLLCIFLEDISVYCVVHQVHYEDMMLL